jgi:hypothetical protein
MVNFPIPRDLLIFSVCVRILSRSVFGKEISVQNFFWWLLIL